MQQSSRRFWLGLFLAGLCSAGCTEPPPVVRVELQLYDSQIRYQAPLAGKLSLHNLTSDHVEINSPGLPPYGFNVLHNTKDVILYSTWGWLLNMIWTQNLAPHQTKVPIEGQLMSTQLDNEGTRFIPPGRYRLQAELWTMEYGVISSQAVPFEILPSAESVQPAIGED